MDEKNCKVVFNGDLALDSDEGQVKERLAEQCKFPAQTIDKILSARRVVLKSGLDRGEAARYKNFFDQLGLLCDVVIPEPEKPDLISATPSEAPLEVKQQGRTCPKCYAADQQGETCSACGIIFKRYEDLQQRLRTVEEDPGEEEGEEDYFSRYPERLFILQSLGVIVLILVFHYLLSDFIPFLVLFFPVGFFIYIRLDALARDESPTQLLAQHITFMPVIYSKEERPQEYIPRVTYGLILANILIFYLFEIYASADLIKDNLIFLPYEPNYLNVPLSAFTSQFLHAGHAHLWGNMLFLWALGTVVERRIGALRFISFYLISGVGAGLLFIAIGYISGGTAIHLLGASGAISGVMGLFAVRCYFKSMVFPLPLLGIFSLFLPISLKVRLNSLVIIGLFFLLDINDGVGQLTGESASNVGHWAHIGGFLCGVLLAMLFRLNREAVTERHMEIGSRAVAASVGGGIGQGEASLRKLLQENPDNLEAKLLLARLRSKFSATDEGRELYLQVFPPLINANPDEAMIAYHDFYKTYQQGLDSKSLYRLAGLFKHHSDAETASRCLELVCNDKDAPDSIREKALYQCARLLEELGHRDAANRYYRLCHELFPASPLGLKAKELFVRSGS